MKKSLLALAVLTAVTGAANAQSSVTLYGKIDLGLVYDSGNPAGKSVRISSGVTGGSRLGFKGVEDLGGGYKAAFQLETGFCADSAANAPNFCTGGNNFMGRQAHGDLSGAFGLASAGRQYSLGFTNLTTVDPFGTGFAGNSAQVDLKNGTYLIDPSGIRLNNSFQYTTPSFAGLTASGEISLGETTGNWEAGREFGGSLNYANGPIYVGAVYFDQENANGAGSPKKNYQLGGTYDLGVVKAHALVEKTTGSSVHLNAFDWLLGATVPVGGGSLIADYINHNDRTSANEDAGQYAIGYLYPLSKRTSVYTSAAKITNKHGADYAVGNATESGTGNKSFDFGVVHNF